MSKTPFKKEFLSRKSNIRTVNDDYRLVEAAQGVINFLQVDHAMNGSEKNGQIDRGGAAVLPFSWRTYADFVQ